MRQHHRFRDLGGRLVAAQEGAALVAAVMVLVISGALAAVAASAALTANEQSSRDKRTKNAIAAADAGINVAIYRLNKLASVLSSSEECAAADDVTGTLRTEAADGDWCAPEVEELTDGASFVYQTSAPERVDVGGQDVWQRRVVATGTVLGVQRRAAMTVNAPTGTALFSAAVFSDEDLILRNSARVDGGVRSNGNVVTQNNSLVCGTVTFGTGKGFLGGNQCAGNDVIEASEPYVLSPVILPDSDDNDRVGTLDPWTNQSQIDWDPGTRVLDMSNTSTLTLTGSNYVFCEVALHNSSQLIVPDDGTPVRIYIDQPEYCPGASGALGLYQSSTILNQSGDPRMVQLYVAGSKTTPTEVQLHNLHELQLVVYAPNSEVTFDNNNRLLGAVSAKKVDMNNNLWIRWDPRLGDLLVGDVPLPIYKRQAWVECSAIQPSTAPDSGC